MSRRANYKQLKMKVMKTNLLYLALLLLPLSCCHKPNVPNGEPTICFAKASISLFDKLAPALDFLIPVTPAHTPRISLQKILL